MSANIPNLEYSLDGLILTNQSGGAIDPHNFNRTFDLLVKKAGVPRITPHTLRHMAATLNKNIGTPLRDVQELLGIPTRK
jgi:integrase